MSSRGGAILAVLILACVPAMAQSAGKFYVRPQSELFFPLDTYADPLSGTNKALYSTLGFGAGSALDFAALPWLFPFVRAQYLYAPYPGGSALSAAEGDIGVGFVLKPADRLSLRLDAMGGLAQIFAAAGSGAAYAAGARLGLEYRLAPAFSLSLSGGYTTYFGSQAPILSALEAGLYLSYDLSALGG